MATLSIHFVTYGRQRVRNRRFGLSVIARDLFRSQMMSVHAKKKIVCYTRKVLMICSFSRNSDPCWHSRNAPAAANLITEITPSCRREWLRGESALSSLKSYLLITSVPDCVINVGIH